MGNWQKYKHIKKLLFFIIYYRIEQKNPLFDRSKSNKSPLFSAIKNFINVTVNSSTSLLSFQVEVNIHKTHEFLSACTHILLTHQSAIWHLDMKHVIML